MQWRHCRLGNVGHVQSLGWCTFSQSCQIAKPHFGFATACPLRASLSGCMPSLHYVRIKYWARSSSFIWPILPCLPNSQNQTIDGANGFRFPSSSLPPVRVILTCCCHYVCIPSHRFLVKPSSATCYSSFLFGGGGGQGKKHKADEVGTNTLHG